MFFGPTPVSQARARLDELLETASGNPLAEAGLLRGVAACDAQEGRFAEARDLLGRVRDTLGDRGGAMVAGHPFITSRVELLAGDPVAAEREAAPGIELLRRAGFSSRAGGLSQILARALLEQGRLGEALEAVEAYVNPADRSTFSGQSIRGAVLARRGDVEKAVTQVRHALALAGETDFLNDRGDTELDAAEVFERAGESEEALAAARRAVELFDRKENIVMAVRARARLDQLAADSQPR
jgi:tetratricopeptide (TPR) repeat protein